MADDNYRFRSNDGRPAPRAAASNNDPLAELARLIGQTDPFAEFGKQPRAESHHAPQADVAWNAPPVAPGQNYEPANYQQQVDDRYAAFDQQGSDTAPPGQGYDDPYYHDDASEPGDGYDDVPPRRRFSILAIAVVFGLVVVGTAGAVGYRALFGSSGSSPPPVIKADTAPTKVVPANNKSEPQSNKLIYDRVGDRSSGEKIVSREEQPIDLGKAAQQPLMPNASSAPAASNIAPAASASPGPAPTSFDQPKKVRTVVIKPDQPQSMPDSPSPAATAAVPPPRPAPAKPVAPPAPPPQRLASAPPVSSADAEDAPPPSRPAPARQPQAAPSRNAPLSLNPNAPASAPARPEPVRTASAPAAAPVSAPAAAGGHYAVQVSSQRSEAEAAAAFRALQGKFPSQLGGRQPLIRRADLGSKGIYYRALVGPFASGSEASELCQSLKAAGGSCLIQKD